MQNFGYNDAGYGASLFSQSMAGFFHSSKSAVIDNKARQELVSKARVLVTTVPLAKAIIDILNRGVIGSGLHLKDTNVTFDALSALHLLDSTRQLDFYQLQQQVWQTTLTCGECFLIRNKGADDAYSSWFAVEPDHVANPPYITANSEGLYFYKGHQVIDGIEFKSDGTPWAIHYCISPYYGNVSSKSNWKRIFFEDKQGIANVIHVKLTDRPEYPRGLPILAPLIETLYSLYALEQSQVQLGIIQACQVFVVKTDTNKSLNPFSGLTGTDMNSPLTCSSGTEHVHEASKDFQITPPNTMDVFGLANNPAYIRPGTSYHLAEGESIEHLSPQGPTDSLTAYYELVVNQCGAALGIPPAMLKGIFDTSFSSSKCSVSQWNYTISKYRKAFIEQCLKPVLRIFLLESGQEPKDAILDSINSVWKNTDPSILLDEARSMAFYGEAVDRGFITKDEACMALFGHTVEDGLKDTE